MKKKLLSIFLGASVVLLTAAALPNFSQAAATRELTTAQQKMLKQNWQTIQQKKKGPF